MTLASGVTAPIESSTPARDMFGMPAVVYVNGAVHSGTLHVPFTQPMPLPHAPQSTARAVPQLSVSIFISHELCAAHSSVSVCGTHIVVSIPAAASFLSLLTEPHAHSTSKQTPRCRIAPGYHASPVRSHRRSRRGISRTATDGSAYLDSNQKPAAYKAAALTVEL